MEQFQYSYSRMCRDLWNLQEAYHRYIKIENLGKTEDGRELLTVLAGREEAHCHLLFQAGMHGREYMNCALLTALLKDYLAGGGAEKNQNICLHVVPMANPDGCTISQEGRGGIRDPGLRDWLWECYKREGREWEQQGRSGKGSGTRKGNVSEREFFSRWKANARGVDINRNFDTGWKGGSLGRHEETSGVMPGKMPDAMSGKMPDAMSGKMPGTMPGKTSGVMPRKTSGVMPGEMPGAMPGKIPGETTTVMPGHKGYPGRAPHSEPETRAILKIAWQYPLACAISWHSSGSLIYWDYGAAGTLFLQDKRLADQLSQATGYPLHSTVTDHASQGGCSDYFMEKYAVPSVTLETGRGRCPLPPGEFPVIFHENRNVWETAIAFSRGRRTETGL